MWVEFEDYDVILYQQETTHLHQDHIKMHEIGHILVSESEWVAEPTREAFPAVGQDKAMAEFTQDWASMLPAFTPEMIRRVARRCSYDDGEECSVELIATIVLERSSLVDGATPLPEDPTLRRVELVLGDHRGWL